MGNCLVGHLNDLDKILMNKERLNGDTQEAVVSMRMVPVKTIFPRLQRSVRQTCRLNGKQVELHLTGGDIMMDSEALNSLVDPIMHLLRNAIDHGIEEREAREHSGKVEGGNVHLDFLRDGSNILIRCKDDGHGLDFEAIRHKAYEIGLLSPDQTVDEEALKRFILLANFSTQSNTTQTSGRGIGLDVVNTKVEELGGSITLESQYGRGCQFDLRLPVSLISRHVPRVRTGAKAFAQITRGDSSPSGEGEPRLGGQEKDPNERIRSVAELLMGFEWISAT
jgi:chemosensory pili system protein ChpA (sensor histidine kinase/response regulator)